MMETEKSLLIIAARNFGDAIITNLVIDTIGASGKYQISVFTKREYKEIFKGNQYIHQIYYSVFPIASNKKMNIFILLKDILNLRGKCFDIGLDLIGDFRERIILRLISAKKILSVEFGENTPFRHLIRNGAGCLVEKILIPNTVVNIYEGLEYVYQALHVKKENIRTKKWMITGKVIGIHPFASQKCKMWPWNYWNELISWLLDNGYEVVLFGTSKEMESNKKNICRYNQCTVHSGDIRAFLDALKKCSLLICLDSFANHAAYYLQVPTIMLNGGNDYKIWNTPCSIVVSHGDNYKCWPCYNVPSCTDFKCMTAIRPAEIINLLNKTKK